MLFASSAFCTRYITTCFAYLYPYKNSYISFFPTKKSNKTNVNSASLTTFMLTGVSVQDKNCWTATSHLIHICPISVEQKKPKSSATRMAGYYLKYTCTSHHCEASKVSQNSCWLRFRRYMNCWTFRQNCHPRIRHCAMFVFSGPRNNMLPSYPVNK